MINLIYHNTTDKNINTKSSQKFQLTHKDLEKACKIINFNIPYAYLNESEMFGEWEGEKKISIPLSLEFNGKALIIIINKNDTIERISFQAVSGRPQEINGKYYFTYEKEKQVLKSEGPIPEGEYFITPLSENVDDGVQELGIVDDIIGSASGALSYFGISKIGAFYGGKYAWGTIRIPIQPKTKHLINPQGQTIIRNNFFIHGGAEAGSAGCIDLWKNNDEFFKVFLTYVEKYKNEILKNNGKIPLKVKYENSTKVECDNAFYTKYCKVVN